MKYKIFTDGSSRGNPGPGGWGVVIVKGKDYVEELGGGEDRTTNNRMELMAAAKALSFVGDQKIGTKTDIEVDVYTDSSYLINGITKWVGGWKRNGWKTKTKEDVLNKDLWIMIDSAVSICERNGLKTRAVKWHHVSGHVGIAGNERCDEIATAFADKERVKLYSGELSEYGVTNILDFSVDPEKMSTKSDSSARSRAKAYSYVSKVDGIIKTHQTWAECESRVKGARGARFKKALNGFEERAIIAEFS